MTADKDTLRRFNAWLDKTDAKTRQSLLTGKKKRTPEELKALAQLASAIAAPSSQQLEGLMLEAPPLPPSLPADDPDPAGRAAALEAARQEWKYDTTTLKGMRCTVGKPASGKPKMSWLAKVAQRAVVVKTNALAVRLGWLAGTAGDLALESAVLGPSTPSPEVSEIQAEQAREVAFAKTLSPWLEGEGPATEAQQQELTAEVEKRLTEILKTGIETPLKPSSELVLESFSPFRSAYGRPDGINDYAKLFRFIDLPKLAKNWQTDETFAWLRVAGPNAAVLAPISKMPDGMDLDDAQFAAIVGKGETVATAAKEQRLFACDYASLMELKRGATYEDLPKYVSAPIAVFAVAKDGALKPVAIKCDQSSDFIVTPLDPNKERWSLAKSVVTVADGNHHELISHLGRTHLLSEVFMLATYRCLAPRHPLNRLLTPHFEGTAFINATARGALIADGGTVDRIFGGTIKSARALTVSSVISYDFVEEALPTKFGKATAKIKDYPYRDDALLLWDAIHDWVTAFVEFVYSAGDNQVKRDSELQAWVKQLRLPVKDGGITGFPRIQSRSELADALTHIIFIGSCQHAAVNFPQRTDMAYAPAFSGAGWRPLPTKDAFISNADRLAFMPPLELAREQLDLLNIIGAVHHTRLGEYGDALKDLQVNKLLKAFQDRLAEIEKAIKAKNADKKTRLRPYEHLIPSTVPMSINI